MADAVVPVLTSKDCKQNLPSWGVTREFRFGQFVQLYDERIANGKRQVTPLKFNTEGDVTELSTASTSSAATAVNPPKAAMPLQAIGASNFEEAIAGTPQTTIDVTDIENLVRSGSLPLDNDHSLQIELGPETVSALRAGDAVLTMGYSDGFDASVVRLRPVVEDVAVNANTLDGVLAARQVETDHGPVRLDDNAIRELIAVGETTAPAWREGKPGRLVRLALDESQLDRDPRPAAENIAIQDLAEFLAAPVVPASDGRSLPVALDEADVDKLRRGQRVQAFVGADTTVVLAMRTGPDPAGPEFAILGKAFVLSPKYLKYDLKRLYRDLYDANFQSIGPTPGGGAAQPGNDGTTTPSSPLLSRTGLPVAILLPWRQTWTLAGFSRGNLLSSLTLAPGEETRLTVSSWERRAKSLQQSAETETEQTFDYTSTTKDTEDVFREMVQSNEFAAQAHASLDASYSTGVATVQVGAGGQISNASSLATTVRTSTQHVRETTNRASTRVRARRITTISESFERTTTTETVRTIRNPNDCHTLTLNFHEVLAHYKVKIEFNRPAVRVVVLIPNPHHVTLFFENDVRVHEATLRAGLLNPALVEGFEACKLLKAYGYAEDELLRLSNMAKTERDQDREREKPKPGEENKPANPFLEPLISLLRDLNRKYTPYPSSNVMDALNTIAAWKSPLSGEVLNANRWLWMRLVATKFGTGLLDALRSIPGAPGPEDARRVVAAIPSPGSIATLDGLGGLPDKDKEDAGLYSTVASNFSAGWWWWYPRLKDNRLYDVVDGGIPGLLNQLRTTFQSWETKAAEGEGLQKAEVVVAKANAEQQQATMADRLEMKFGAEVVGAAMERREALLAHLNEYVDYYRYVLFQGMPPSEQMRLLMEAAPQLRIGMFEPHVVASDGSNLAVPLTPLGESTLATVVTNLTDILEDAAEQAQAAGDQIAVDDVILTTPGVSVESWLGQCSGCEEHVKELQTAQVRQAEADAELLELEARRRKAKLDAVPPQLDATEHLLPAFRVELTREPPD